MIVNRDSNDIGFMDIKTKKMIGNVFLGNNVNPHMVMMSPDGRYVVTGGTRANKAYIIDTRTLQLVKVIPTDIAPEHLAFSPDSRWYYQGNPDGDSISVIDMQSLSKIKTIPGLRRAAERHVPPDGIEGLRRQLRRALGRRRSTCGGTSCSRRFRSAAFPAVAKLDPAKYLGEIKGINIAAPSIDGRYLYVADSDLADRRRHRHARGQGHQDDPRRQGSVAHLHEPRRQVRHHHQQRRRDDLDHRHQVEQRRGDARGRPGHDRRQLRRRQGLRHQLDQRLRLCLRHVEPEAGRAASRSAPTSSSKPRRRTPRTGRSTWPNRPTTKSSSSIRRTTRSSG